MPIFKIRQIVTHPFVRRALVKESHIIGRDLGHAIECIRCPEPMKRELRKKYWSRTTEPKGRTIHIEIIEEKKA